METKPDHRLVTRSPGGVATAPAVVGGWGQLGSVGDGNILMSTVSPPCSTARATSHLQGVADTGRARSAEHLVTAAQAIVRDLPALRVSARASMKRSLRLGCSF
jgi:hypothetical protein